MLEPLTHTHTHTHTRTHELHTWLDIVDFNVQQVGVLVEDVGEGLGVVLRD